MEKYITENLKTSIDELKIRIEKLNRYQTQTNAEVPISLQMMPELYDFSEDEKKIIISFPVQKKVLNPNKAMIGGLITNAVDISSGLLIFALGGDIIPPTITMTTNFINPIFENDTLLVEAKIVSWGKRIINISAIGLSKDNGKTIVTSTLSFVSVDSFKPSIKK